MDKAIPILVMIFASLALGFLIGAVTINAHLKQQQHPESHSIGVSVAEEGETWLVCARTYSTHSYTRRTLSMANAWHEDYVVVKFLKIGNRSFKIQTEVDKDGKWYSLGQLKAWRMVENIGDMVDK